ncbi:MAG: hypothetical protein RL021_786 [Bacteroidota bacterium]|jgi:cytochrome c oxidase cbb3-type subunit IV
MFKNYLKGIDGIQQYPLLLLVVFFVFFTVTVIYLWKTDRTHFDEMSELPLNDSLQPNKPTSNEKNTGL